MSKADIMSEIEKVLALIVEEHSKGGVKVDVNFEDEADTDDKQFIDLQLRLEWKG